MSAYLKALSLHIFLTTTKKSHAGNDKYLEDNTQVIDALKHTLSKEYFSLISHCDLAFAKHIDFSQGTNDKLFVEGIYWKWSDQAYFMVQENDSLEVIWILI